MTSPCDAARCCNAHLDLESSAWEFNLKIAVKQGIKADQLEMGHEGHGHLTFIDCWLCHPRGVESSSGIFCGQHGGREALGHSIPKPSGHHHGCYTSLDSLGKSGKIIFQTSLVRLGFGWINKNHFITIPIIPHWNRYFGGIPHFSDTHLADGCRTTVKATGLRTSGSSARLACSFYQDHTTRMSPIRHRNCIW